MEMTTSEIKTYLKPSHEEIFDAYLCLGYVSGSKSQKPILIGSLGNGLKYPEENAKLRICIKKIKEVIEDGTEDQEGLGGF